MEYASLEQVRMPVACFQSPVEFLCHYLRQARRRIQVAVCWFSQREIFELLLHRLHADVQVELLLEYDTQNIRPEGLDFQQFIKQGGYLYGSLEASLMHHKFALVDDTFLLTGSFNWTYNSNAENLVLLEDAALLRSFQQEFERLRGLSKRIFRVRQQDAKIFAAFPLFENTCFPLLELRKKVGGGARVWTVALPHAEQALEQVFRQAALAFDPSGLLSDYWTAYRIWDDALFDEEFERLRTCSATGSGQPLRALRCWARRMKPGDLVFATKKGSAQLLGIGVLQSEPQPYAEASFSSCRAVQWLKILAGEPYLLAEMKTKQSPARYRGSALHVLQEVLGT